MCECATKKGRSQLIEIELDLYAIKSSGSIFSVTAFPSTTQGVYAKDETPGIFVNVKNHREKDTRLVLKGETVAFNPKNAHHDQVTTEVLVAGNSTGSFLLELPRQKPGFYTFDFTFTAREGEAEAEKEPLASVPFSVAFGSEIHAIPDSEAPTPPKDLREFWDTTLAKLARVDPAYTKTPVPGRTTDRLKAFRVSFTTFGEKRYEAWFTVPFDAAQPNKRYPAILIFPGYGDAPYPFPSEFLLEPILRKYVVMGLRINAKPVDEPTPQHMGYIQSGIASRETFIYRDIYSATVRAFRYLRSSDSVTSSEIFTVGGSQGGGLALAAAALNREAAGCISMAPFLCDFPGAVRPDAIWPYDQVLEYLTKNPQDRERVFQTLSYYDVANLGAWVKCPTLFFIGVQDKICPPETTIKAYHRIPGPKTLGVYAMVGHAFPERFYIDMMDFLISVLKKPGA